MDSFKETRFGLLKQMLQNFGGKLLGKSKCQNNEFELWRTEACVLGFCLVWNRKRMNICVTTPNFGKYQPSFFFFFCSDHVFLFFLKKLIDLCSSVETHAVLFFSSSIMLLMNTYIANYLLLQTVLQKTKLYLPSYAGVSQYLNT